MTETKTTPQTVVLELVTAAQLPVPVPTEPSLSDLTARIRAGHSDAEAAVPYGADAYIRAGHALIAAKKQLHDQRGHGHWQDYVAFECGLTMRVAQRYMYLAKREDKLREILAEKRLGKSYLSQGALFDFLRT